MMFGRRPEERHLGEERDLEHDRDDHDQRDPERDAPRDDHSGHPRSRRAPPVGDLDEVEVAEVGERLDVDALVGLLLADGRLASRGRSGSRAGTPRRSRRCVHPAVTTIWPSWMAWLVVDEVEQQVARDRPTSGSATPVGAVGKHARRDGAAVVGDQRDLGGAAR